MRVAKMRVAKTRVAKAWADRRPAASARLRADRLTATAGKVRTTVIQRIGVERLVAAAFTSLYRPERERSADPSEPVKRAIITQFNRLYYHSPDIPWRTTRYRGVPVAKAPTDLWIYQELITELRPSWIVETGTHYGGSAYYFADLCELVGHGQVISIDVAAKSPLPAHPRIPTSTGRPSTRASWRR